ncbi:hypothetical protein [Williamsia deligens]|uniref:Condensation domain-containing protein n=1 Tax=Williamsia deligens TaxID=321325 RepID=A0ABW3GCQ8_9NOCA|nr:hypothetical protein [Williamsia deligens]MCP2192649.1 hypothetical protein [Williamsia deligens]
MSDSTVPRFSVVDDMYYRGHHGRGPSTVMQGVWRFSERIAPDDLAAMHAALSAGALTRRVHSPRTPWARRCLVGGGRVTPLFVDDTPIHDVVAWADRRAQVPLDVDTGPVWELALGHVESGGSVVTLSCSHLVSGGVGMVAMAEASLATGDAVPEVTPAPQPPGWRDDIRDAVLLWVHVVWAVLVSFARAFTDPAVRDELLDAARGTAAGGTRAVSAPDDHRTLLVDVDAEAFAALARRENATPTALFVALVAAAARRLHGRDAVRVAVPVAMPDGAVGSSVVTVASDTDLGDLSRRIRTVAARARERVVTSSTHPADPLASVVGAPGGMPDELMQVLGDRIAGRVVGDPGMADGLASSLGFLPDAFLGVGGHPSTGLAVRAVTTNRSAAKTGVGAWMARSSARVTFAFDVTGATGDEDVVADTLTAWGLDHHPW